MFNKVCLPAGAGWWWRAALRHALKTVQPRSLTSPVLPTCLLVAFVFCIAPQRADSATLEATSPGELAAPITQHFITLNASVVEGGGQWSCRVFQAIDVRASRYTAPSGVNVPFADVARSPAAGVWLVGAPALMGEAPVPPLGRAPSQTRIVLKYPVQSLTMVIDGRITSLTENLDKAGDSVTLSAAAQATLEQAWQSQTAVMLRGVSRDTGRVVVDLVPPISQTDMAACANVTPPISDAPSAEEDVSALSGERVPGLWLASAIDVTDQSLQVDTAAYPRHGPLGVTWADRVPGAPDKSDLTGCRMTDLGGEIERYRLATARGFVSSSGEVWITRDQNQEIRQVYIPGEFEALRDPKTQDWVADVSIAAFANDPFEEPVFKGCLGTQEITMTGEGDSLAERSSLFDLLDNVAFVSAALAPEGEAPGFLPGIANAPVDQVTGTPTLFQASTLNAIRTSSPDTDQLFPFRALSLFVPVTANDPLDPNTPLSTQPLLTQNLPASVPLPLSLVLLLSALAALATLRSRA